MWNNFAQRGTCLAMVGCLVWAFAESTFAADTVRQIPTQTNDLIHDPFTGKIFASVPSTAAGGTGNSIKTIDPVAGTIGAAGVFVGSEPTKLVRTDNGQYLYVALDGAAAVRRYDIASATAGLQFSLGTGGFGPMYVEDMEAVPNQPDSVAVSRKRLGVSPRHDGVAIYDNGVRRTTTTPDHTGSNVIEFTNSSFTLYGYNNETTDFGFRTMSVTAAGVATTNSTGNLISGFGVNIDSDGTYIYSTTGRKIDPVSRTLLGSFASSGLVEADGPNHRVYFLSGSTITAYNSDTFIPVGSITVNGISGSPSSLIRWGTDGLAFRTPTQVFLINSTLVPEPTMLATTAIIGAGLALRRRRRR